jgi:membrane-bound lytic murein transglycosylase B
MKRREALALVLAGAAGAPSSAAALAAVAAGATPYPLRDDVQAYLDELVDAYALDRDYAGSALAQARYSAEVQRLATPGPAAGSDRDWTAYRARHIDERRLREAAGFARKNAGALERAQRAFGVPAEVIVAIIGIETNYGRTMGHYATLDVLATLSFDYVRRAALYRDELAQFLLWCRERGVEPPQVRGSFAGAIGMPQFMPGSVRRYGVDFDGDGQVDLAGSATDAIGSVANFLAAHGWTRDLPVSLPAQVPAAASARVGGIAATTPWRELAATGVRIDGDLPEDLAVLLIDLPQRAVGSAPPVLYRVGTANLAALLHYNRSYFYASAVADLAGEIRRRTRRAT